MITHDLCILKFPNFLFVRILRVICNYLNTYLSLNAYVKLFYRRNFLLYNFLLSVIVNCLKYIFHCGKNRETRRFKVYRRWNYISILRYDYPLHLFFTFIVHSCVFSQLCSHYVNSIAGNLLPYKRSVNTLGFSRHESITSVNYA